MGTARNQPITADRVFPPTLQLYREISSPPSPSNFLKPTDHRRRRRPPLDNTTPQTFTMGRLHSNGKGISASAVPYSRNVPSWLKTTPEQVVDQICKLAKKGATPSQIGVVLRDSHGIAQVRIVTGMLLSGGCVGGGFGGSALTGS